MDIDGERFETWPSTPNHPMAECLLRVEESDAIILLLGTRYGTPSPLKSGTHLEYEHAENATSKRPIFAYLLEVKKREPKQDEFIKAIFKKRSLCRPISSLEELKNQVKRSLNEEFIRCFRSVHLPSPEVSSISISASNATKSPHIALALDLSKAQEQLYALYSKDDMAIHQIATECESRFGTDPEIMNLVFMAEVNLAINGTRVSRDRLLKAVNFWSSEDAKKRWGPEVIFYNQGNALHALGRQIEAIDNYEAALALNPDFAQCMKNLGNAYLSEGNIRVATEWLEKALKIEPALFEALHSLAILAMREGQDFDMALKYLSRISLSDISNECKARVHYLKAYALLNLRRYPEGIAEAENSIMNSSDVNWSWEVAARLYALARHDDKTWLKPALRFWQRFLDRFPRNAWAWAEIGFVYWFLKKEGDTLSQRALNAFEKSVQLGSDKNGLVWDRIGHLYQERQNWVEAENAFRRAYLIDSGEFGFCLGTSLMDLGKYKEATPLMLAAAEKYQRDALSWQSLAVCYEKTMKEETGNAEMAEAAYKKAIELDQNFASAWFNLGGFYWNKGDHFNAFSTWEEAIQKFPENHYRQRVKEFLAAPYYKRKDATS
jgi:tetratricopeptide (TPR) repeat protein